MSQFIPAPLPSQINPQTAAQPMSRGSGGFVVRNDFSASGMAPQIDRRAFVQATASRGAIGEGIQAAGQQLDKIAQVRFHAVNQRRVLEARSVMEMAEGDLAKALASEKDTSKWEGLAQKHAESIKEMVMAKDLSPDAREAIDLQHLKWTGDVVRNAKVSAANRELQLLGEHHNANFIRAVNDGDFDGARQAVQDWQSSGTLAEDQAASKLGQVSASEDKKRFNDLLYLVDQNPREAVGLIEAHENQRPFTSLEKLNLERATKASLNNHRAMDNQMLSDAVATGTVKSPDDLEAFDYLTPTDKAEWKERLFKPATNDKVLYLRVTAAIAGYKQDEDEDRSKLAELRSIIAKRFDTGMEQTLRERLEERTKSVKPDAVPLKDAFDVLLAWAFDDKRFGEYETQKTDNAGRGIFKKVVVQSLQADGTLAEVEQLVPEKEIDPVKRDAVTNRVQGIMQQIESEAKAGKITDRLQLMQRLSALTGQSVTAEAAGQVMPRATLFPTGQPSAMPDINAILKKYAPNPGK